MKRQYTAYADNGRDYVTFEFESTHRANSKCNLLDARIQYKKKHGYRNNIHVYKTVYNKVPVL